jgi:hypothetical protein
MKSLGIELEASWCEANAYPLELLDISYFQIGL